VLILLLAMAYPVILAKAEYSHHTPDSLMSDIFRFLSCPSNDPVRSAASVHQPENDIGTLGGRETSLEVSFEPAGDRIVHGEWRPDKTCRERMAVPRADPLTQVDHMFRQPFRFVVTHVRSPFEGMPSGGSPADTHGGLAA
jgi:hypothetical protein